MTFQRAAALAQREFTRRRALHQVVEDLHAGQHRCVYAWDPRDPLVGQQGADVEEAKQAALRGGAELACLVTHRRWGKTEGLLRYLFHTCTTPRHHGKPAICAYVNQEREYARDVIWPIVEDLIEKYPAWNAIPDERNMRVLFYADPGHKKKIGTLKLYGADQARWQRRMRGKQFDAVVVDEAQDFTFSDLEHLVKRVLYATLADRLGRLWLAGTPGEVENYFFTVQSEFTPEEVEEQRAKVVVSRGDPMFVVVRGDYLENPHTRAELQGQINRARRANPNIDNEPWFQREYMSLWVPDTRRNIIQLAPDLNYLYEWERHSDDRFCLGIDFGFPDFSAYVLLTWNPDRHPYYIYIDAWERKSMQVHEHVESIREYMRNYPGLSIVGDPSWFGGKDAPSTEALVADLQTVHGLPIEPATKKDKKYAVERLYSEATMGHLRVYNAENPAKPEDCAMARQWRKLVRLKDGSEGKPRHLHDAALYARRRAAPWMFRGEITPEERSVKIQNGMRAARMDALKKRRDSRTRRRRLTS